MLVQMKFTFKSIPRDRKGIMNKTLNKLNDNLPGAILGGFFVYGH